MDQFAGETIAASPLGGLPSGGAEEVAAECSALRIEPLGPAPNVGECLLHRVLGRLFVAKKPPEEAAQARCVFSIPGIECLGVAVDDLLPEFPVVEQLALQCVLRVQEQKGSIATENFRRRSIRTGAADVSAPYPVFGSLRFFPMRKPVKGPSRRQLARTMICHRGRFREPHTPLRIGNAIIPPSIRAENRGGWDESREQPFRWTQ